METHNHSTLLHNNLAYIMSAVQLEHSEGLYSCL